MLFCSNINCVWFPTSQRRKYKICSFCCRRHSPVPAYLLSSYSALSLLSAVLMYCSPIPLFLNVLSAFLPWASTHDVSLRWHCSLHLLEILTHSQISTQFCFLQEIFRSHHPIFGALVSLCIILCFYLTGPIPCWVDSILLFFFIIHSCTYICHHRGSMSIKVTALTLRICPICEFLVYSLIQEKKMWIMYLYVLGFLDVKASQQWTE